MAVFLFINDDYTDSSLIGSVERIAYDGVIFWQGNENLVDDGIQIEPFNLDKEREEGYFDAQGNFVEYVKGNEIKVRTIVFFFTMFSMWKGTWFTEFAWICRMHGLIALMSLLDIWEKTLL